MESDESFPPPAPPPKLQFFGQIVIGPPGCGKSTYCHALQQFFSAIKRDCAIINLDPANEQLQYECALNIEELVTLQDVMDEFNLGPNGAMMYCMELLEKNVDWLKTKVKALAGKYLVFDLPGQTELFTHHPSLRHILDCFTEKEGFRLSCVHLVDALYCSEPAKFVSAVLLSLLTMLHLELPHVNLISKTDLLRNPAFSDTLAFPIEFFTEVQDLSMLLERIVDPAQPSEEDEDEEEEDEFSTYGLKKPKKKGEKRKVIHKSLAEAALESQLEGEEKDENKRDQVESGLHTVMPSRFKALNAALSDVVQDFNLVNFLLLDITRKSSMLNIVETIDQTHGFIVPAEQREALELVIQQAEEEDQRDEEEKEMEFKQKNEELYGKGEGEELAGHPSLKRMGAQKEDEENAEEDQHVEEVKVSLDRPVPVVSVPAGLKTAWSSAASSSSSASSASASSSVLAPIRIVERIPSASSSGCAAASSH